ncbi:MAG: hypothetical protein ACLFTY_01940 [Candidatus Aenigmatarchaeota archaeon]
MKIIETGIDEIVDYLHEENSSDLKELSEMFGYPEEVVEEWLKALEEHGVVEIDYSITGMKVEILEKSGKDKAKEKVKEGKKGEHVCDECGKSFDTEHGLNIHEGMKHGDGD